MDRAVSIFRNLRQPRGSYPETSPITFVGTQRAYAEISGCPRYAPTPLVRLERAAQLSGVSQVYYKDESTRFGLSSFKPLGGIYAVGKVLSKRVSAACGHLVDFGDLVGGQFAALTREYTVTCASDGNHGRAVAAGARLFGCRCVIFLHENVSAGRERIIRDLGAEVVRTKGDYDESVRHAAEMASRNGWVVVADTSSDPNDPVPVHVMEGYTVLAREIFEELYTPRELPTHVFLQGGVGGLAAAVVAFFWMALGNEAPLFVVVEPERADCLYRSAIAGRPTRAAGDLHTLMAGLACGEVSRVAWPLLQAGVDYFMTIPDSFAIDMMKGLADGSFGHRVVAGESATAGLAALMHTGRGELSLNEASRVLVIGTEGATDPEIYEQLTNASAERSFAK